METRHLLIRGQVQGVGFRYSMAAQARLLGVTGWVRNRRDGSVEAVVAGDAAQLEAMLAWSRNGPPDAVVDQVIEAAGDGAAPASFEIRPSA